MAGSNSGHNKIYRRKQFRSRSHRKKYNVHNNHSTNSDTSQPVDRSTICNTSSSPSSSSGVVTSSVISSPRTLAFESLTITSGFGYDLLRKAGWKPGQSLGLGSSDFNINTTSPAASASSASPFESSTSDSDAALSTPLPIVIRHSRAGVGASENASTPSSTTPTPMSTKTFNTNKFNNNKHAHTRSRKNYNRQNKPRYIKHNQRNDMADNSEDEQFGSIDVPRSYASHSNKDMSVSPTSIVSHMAKLDIFDPLCPHCPYDSNHVVRDLKALRKHVKNCPANPDRAVSRHSSGSFDSIAPSPGATPQGSSLVDLDALSCSSVGSPDVPSSGSIDSDVELMAHVLQRSLSFRDSPTNISPPTGLPVVDRS